MKHTRPTQQSTFATWALCQLSWSFFSPSGNKFGAWNRFVFSWRHGGCERNTRDVSQRWGPDVDGAVGSKLQLGCKRVPAFPLIFSKSPCVLSVTIQRPSAAWHCLWQCKLSLEMPVRPRQIFCFAFLAVSTGRDCVLEIQASDTFPQTCFACDSGLLPPNLQLITSGRARCALCVHDHWGIQLLILKARGRFGC